MEHELAIESNAVERYALGEMSAKERDAFEDHYFSCEQCADDVRTTQIFVENAKAVLREPAQPAPLVAVTPSRERSRGWLPWLSPQVVFGGLATAFAAMLAVQTAQVNRLSVDHLRPIVVLSDTRAKVPSFAAGEPLSLLIPNLLNAPAAGSKLTVEIRNESGAAVRSYTEDMPDGTEGLQIYLPNPKLDAGNYSVVIGSTNYPFRIRP